MEDSGRRTISPASSSVAMTSLERGLRNSGFDNKLGVVIVLEGTQY